MLSFENDYNRGAHPEILRRFLETNMDMEVGYGNDSFCASAREKIKAACSCPDADVFFLSGGTQTNAIVIDAYLAKYEGVVSAQTGHINVHESGAVEFTGHKILTVPEHDGKIIPSDLTALLEGFWKDADHEHMVFPGLVYISHPTERGTLYSKDELEAISEVCRKYEIPLFMDGARMGYGLMSYETDLTLADIANYCDAFYIGGTKNGALFGEAVVIVNDALKPEFRYAIKQNGGMLAKGRLLGIQFKTLFTDDLFFRAAEHANACAMKLKRGFEKAGVKFFVDSVTNQQFPIFTEGEIAELAKVCLFERNEQVSETECAIRFCTSWATKDESIDEIVSIVHSMRTC